MKKTRILYTVLLFLIFPLSSICQIDTTYYSYTDTCIGVNLSDYDKLLRHIIPEKQEVTRLYKFNLIQYAQKRVNVSFEHKLKNNWSLEYKGVIRVINYKAPLEKKNFDIHIPNQNSLYYLVLSSNFKYFHNFDKRIKKGKNINGFAGNYFTMGATAKIGLYNPDKWFIAKQGSMTNFYNPTIRPKTMISYGKLDDTQSIIYLNAGYGWQRRIGNVGYWSAEAKMGVGTNKYFNTLYLVPEVNIKLGFALTSLKINRK